jgi:hypothetical protein
MSTAYIFVAALLAVGQDATVVVSREDGTRLPGASVQISEDPRFPDIGTINGTTDKNGEFVAAGIRRWKKVCAKASVKPTDGPAVNSTTQILQKSEGTWPRDFIKIQLDEVKRLSTRLPFQFPNQIQFTSPPSPIPGCYYRLLYVQARPASQGGVYYRPFYELVPISPQTVQLGRGTCACYGPNP